MEAMVFPGHLAGLACNFQYCVKCSRRGVLFQRFWKF